MDADALERIAESAYARAGYSATQARSPLRLAHTLIGHGREHVVYDTADLEHEATLWTSPCGHDALLLRKGITPGAAWWFGARVLARWLLDRLNSSASGADVDYLAACLRAPRSAVSAIAAETGPVFSDLGAAFKISESSAALRFAEVSGTPLALIAPGRPVRIRGHRRPGVKFCRMRLSDAPERVVLLGA